jgi:hypothetical protein
MALKLGALRERLLQAGAGVEKADAAAEELTSYQRAMAGLRSDLKLLKGMCAAQFVLLILALVVQGALWAKLSEIAAGLP